MTVAYTTIWDMTSARHALNECEIAADHPPSVVLTATRWSDQTSVRASSAG
jgi:hypothetical protein